MQHLQPNTTLQGGKYRIKRVLGQGGFGITYLAVQSSLNRYVAIKELFIGGSGQAINDRRGNMVVVTNSANQASFNQQKEKFKKEALRLANLNHPNLVKVHELFEENGTAYYVMDYIDGMSLRTKLNKEGCLPESLVLKYLKQLLSALEVAHRQSIWHLDIKPENIMVDKFDHVCLIDFGASKHIEQGGTLTTSLALAYTRSYCPPELADLSYESETSFVQTLKEIGPWTDIYSLGATIYNLLTENIPPSSNRLYKEGRNAFIFPNTISSSAKDLIVRMMNPNREERPQSIEEVSSALLDHFDISWNKNQDGKRCLNCGYKFDETFDRNICPICKSPINNDLSCLEQNNSHYTKNEDTIIESLSIDENMRAKKGFNLRNVCGENVIVAEGKENVDFNSIVTMNESSAFLWNKIQKNTAFNAKYLATLLTREYDVDRDTAIIDAKQLLEQWYRAGIIEKTVASITYEKDEFNNSNNFSNANTSNSGCLSTFIFSIISTIIVYFII